MAQDICDRPTVARTGSVVSSGEGWAQISLAVPGACASCAMQKTCTDGGAGRTIRVWTDRVLEPGELVTVTMESRHGLLAVLLLFIVPLALLVGTVFALSAAGVAELVCALGGLGAAAIYGAVLWLLNDKLQKRIPIRVDRRAE